MKTHKFKNGDQIPALGLGTWKSEPGEVYWAIRSAISLGYRHFDCAYIYQNENEIGNALNDAISNKEVSRKDLWVTSKLWNTHHLKDDVQECLKMTLESLKLDYLDLYLIHWPVAHHKDIIFPREAQGLVSLKEIPLEQTWSGMEKVQQLGLTKHIGVSNFSSEKISHINATATQKIEVNQIELHPLLQQDQLLNFCKKENIIVTAYSPLGSRDRIAQMKAENEPDLFEIPIIKKIANNHSCTPAQILIAWAISRDTVVIPKSTNEARLAQNLEATEINLSEDEMNEIQNLDKHYRYVTGEFFALPGSDYTVAGLWDE